MGQRKNGRSGGENQTAIGCAWAVLGGIPSGWGQFGAVKNPLSLIGGLKRQLNGLYPFPSLSPKIPGELTPYHTSTHVWPLRNKTRGRLIQKRPRISTYLSESFSATCWIFLETFWLSKYPFSDSLIKKRPPWAGS